MGKCCSRANVVHPLPPDTQTDHVLADSESRSNVQVPLTPEAPRRVVDPSVPESFYPATVEISTDEEKCRLIKSKISCRKVELQFRLQLQELLNRWKRDATLEIIEAHALSIPAENTVSVEKLALSIANQDARYMKSLGDSGQVGLAVAKAYAIFFWISSNIQFSPKSWRNFITNPESLGSRAEAKHVLEKRECISKGHANLFHSVATAVGLKTCVVMGNIKIPRSDTHNPTDQFECNKLNQHWWNMFCIEGIWIPVDCACGSGLVAPYLNYHHKFVPHYFAVNPEHLIFSHIPVKSEHQLLQQSVSSGNMSPLISPSVVSLSLGVEPLSWAETIDIDRDSPTTTIKMSVRVPSNVRLSGNLRRASDIHLDTPSKNLNNSPFQATFIQIHDNNQVNIIYVTVPGKGIFFLDIYTHRDNHALPCFSYQINCLTKPAPYKGFPTVYDLPSVAFKFKPLYWNTPNAANVCENHEGKMDLVFQCLPGAQFYHCLLPGNKCNQSVDLDAQHYCTAITRDVTDHSLYKLNVVFPATGWWTIYLCAAKKTGDQVSGYTALFNFPVLVRKEMSKCTYPHVHSPDVHFQLDEPISCSGQEILAVPFFSARDLKLHSTLCHEHLEDEVQHQEYTLTRTLEGLNERGEHKYVVQVVFPKPGKWFVRAYANSAEELPTEGYLSLFDLFLDVDNCLENAVFPVLDQDVMNKCSINLLHPEHLITLNEVNKQTPLLKFIAPTKVAFGHYIEPASYSPATGSTETLFYRHFTYLSAVEKMGTDTRYDLRALFPTTGIWKIVLTAAETSLSNQKVALTVIVNNTNYQPQANVKIFPVLHPALSDFGISFSADKTSYPKHCSSPEFHFEFQSLNSVNFAWTLQDIQSQKLMPHSCNVFLEKSKEIPGDKTLRKLRVVFPKPGIWIIQVAARNVLSDIVSDNTLSLSLHYQQVFDLIVEASTAAHCHMSFPRIHESFHTPFGLHIDGSDIPLPSRVNQLPTTCKIKFYSPPGVLFWHHCTESSQLQDRKITRMTSNAETGLHELCADITKRGQWTIYLHAKLQDDTSKTWTAVLQHTIVVKSSRSFSSSSFQ